MYHILSITHMMSDSTQGPYCEQCKIRDSTHYYDGSACKLCKGSRFWLLWVALGVLAFLGLLGVGWHNRKRAPRLLQLLIRWVYSRLSQLRLRAKLKQLLTFC